MTNAGGMNPGCCVREAAAILSAAGLANQRVAMVSGDDLLSRLAELQSAGCRFENLDTGRPLAELAEPVVSANAYRAPHPLQKPCRSVPESWSPAAWPMLRSPWARPCTSSAGLAATGSGWPERASPGM